MPIRSSKIEVLHEAVARRRLYLEHFVAKKRCLKSDEISKAGKSVSGLCSELCVSPMQCQPLILMWWERRTRQ